ncbi:uncharacterized protein BJX67DRAFT_296340 [Aspergillus lucknowensis]|uniref:Uncharacterized protein n=1 Tax=Aspergillus lucknowensis TaxID=176173 RepID=A0ABR4LDM0_9EURO
MVTSSLPTVNDLGHPALYEDWPVLLLYYLLILLQSFLHFASLIQLFFPNMAILKVYWRLPHRYKYH